MARRLTYCLVLLPALLLGACASGGLFGGPRAGTDPQPLAATAGDAARPTAESLAVYLELLRRLIEGDTVTQAEAFREAARSAELAPTTTNRLKYALALATPGHVSSDATQAQRALNSLLSQADALLPEERVLATIHLKNVEQRLILDAAANEQRRTAEAELEQQNAENVRQLEAALAENRRLRVQLEEATEALDAITTIERSIRERDNDAP